MKQCMFCGLVSNKENRIIMQSRNKLETQQPSRAEASMFLWWKHVSKKVKKWELGDAVWAKNEKNRPIIPLEKKKCLFLSFPMWGQKSAASFKNCTFFHWVNLFWQNYEWGLIFVHYNLKVGFLTREKVLLLEGGI